jgi:uncharacterized sulfatase
MGEVSRRDFLKGVGLSAAAVAVPSGDRQGLPRAEQGVAVAPAAETPRSRPPNILFILADDLGYGDLGCYGQPKVRTPNLDRLAAEGIRFTDAYAGSTVCAPSRCSLMTGLHTGRCLVRGNARLPLRPEDVTVAEVLKGAGYATGLAGKWGLGEAGSSGVPTRQGFDVFFGYLNQHHAHNYWPTFLWRNEERVALQNVVSKEDVQGGGVASTRAQYSHDLVTEEALAFIERQVRQPWFLYLAWTIPHANNEAGREGMEVPDQGPYAAEPWPEQEKNKAAMITRMDRDVGRVLEKIKALGLDADTIVFFTSDNGPHKEGGADPAFFRSSGPLRGIKRDLYEGGIRVPMIVRWPGHIKPGSVSDYPWAFWDFLPTAADLAGAAAPKDLDGVSVLPVLLGRPGPERECLYWEFYEQGGTQAVRRGRWKAVRKGIADSGAPMELYDLPTDLGETKDVAAAHPDLVREMAALMRKAHTPSPHWAVRPKRGSP